MFQTDSHYECCAYTAAGFEVLRFDGAISSPRGQEPALRDPSPRPWGGTVTMFGGDYKGGGG